MSDKERFNIGDKVTHADHDSWGIGEIMYVDTDTMTTVSNTVRYHVKWEKRRPNKMLWCLGTELRSGK